MKENYYFAYGSNMNLHQMDYRCPASEVVENVRLEDYRLAFRGRNPGNGVATILPEKGSHVDGVLWNITPDCEKSLDHYEGYPSLYGKEQVIVQNQAGERQSVMVYVMNAPYKDVPSRPSDLYLKGILEGCHENGIASKPIMDAVKRTREEMLKDTNLEKTELVGKAVRCDRSR